jgi:hypothetical protein
MEMLMLISLFWQVLIKFPLPGPAGKTGSVGSGSETMGAEELVNGKAGFHEMEEDDNFSDSELVYHVRDALSSVSSVSILPLVAYCLLYALGCIS